MAERFNVPGMPEAIQDSREPPIRSTREIEHLCGVGGHLTFQWEGWKEHVTDFPFPEILEVQQWEIDREFLNARLPMSGGYGSISYRRVADDFVFAAVLDMDLTSARQAKTVAGTTREISSHPRTHPFVDGKLEGHRERKFRVSIRFNCGDRSFWEQPEIQGIARPLSPQEGLLRGVHYYCDSVLLKHVYVVNSSKGDSVTRYVVHGQGSAPLRRYIDTVWCGAGAIGLSQTAQGHATTPL